MAPTMSLKPPLAVSPRRLRPRPHRLARSDVAISSPAAAFSMVLANRSRALEEYEIRTEYETISLELQSLAKKVRQEIGNDDPLDIGKISADSLFERGRFYEEYSARRNERLKRKKREVIDEVLDREPSIDLDLRKKWNVKRVENLRRSVPTNFSVGHERILRSSTRTSKDVKTPFAITNYGVEGERKTGSRSCWRK